MLGILYTFWGRDSLFMSTGSFFLPGVMWAELEGIGFSVVLRPDCIGLLTPAQGS